MADYDRVDIPIWPGSSSFASGSTPFGTYDSDSLFQVEADKVAKWCANKLGYPIMDVELQAIHFYQCLEEAAHEYSRQVNEYNIRDNMFVMQGITTSSNLTQRNVTPNMGRFIQISKEYGTEAGTGGYTTWHSGSITVTSSVQNYDLNVLWRDIHEAGEVIEIKKIHHYAPQASNRFYDTSLSANAMRSDLGFDGMAMNMTYELQPVYADALRIQAIEFSQMIRRSAYSFRLVNNKLKLFPTPTSNFTLWFEYIVKSERDNPLKDGNGLISDMSNIPYDWIPYRYINSVGRKWIYSYTLALCKEVLGGIRGKYASIPIPDGEVTLNSSELLSAAQDEKTELIEKLRETLEETSRTRQIEKQKEEAENTQQKLRSVPLKFYVR